MVAHILRLRIALLVGAVRGSVGHVARVAISGILLIAVTVAACWAIVTVGDESSRALFAVTVVAGSAVTLGFVVAPFVVGGEDPLDPRRFALLALRDGGLSAALALAGVISVPIAAVVVVATASAVVWGAHGSTWLAGIASAVATALTCALAARVSFALSRLVFGERRSREFAGIFVVVVLVLIVPIGVFLASLGWDGDVPAPFVDVATALSASPLGAAWAIPAASAGASSVLAGSVAAATLILLAAGWWLLVRQSLRTIERPASGRERVGLGWFAMTPGTPGGAIAARSLLYWSQDRRYLVNLLVIPIAAVVTVVPLYIAGVPFETAVLVPVLFAALFFGWLPHNDLAYDSSAVWMHLAAGVGGVSDRIGRLIPVLVLGVPFLAIAVPLTALLHGDWSILPSLIGVTASLFLSGLGLSSIASAVAPYAVSRPGESPFQQPQRTGSGGAIAQASVMLGSIVVTLPVLWWSWETLSGAADRSSIALWGGIGIGIGVLLVGLAVGALIFRRYGGRLMEFAEST